MDFYQLWMGQVHMSWYDLGNKLHENNLFPTLELKDDYFPIKDNIFMAFKLTPLNELHTVLLGQDPYHHIDKNTNTPAACGLSFSIPEGQKIPSSLNNMNRNWKKFGHTNKTITDLTCLAKQGILLLNTSLTVKQGKPNSHQSYWKDMTDFIIKYISNNTKNTVFILFGKPALTKKKLINDTHNFIISSHPSGLSCNNKLQEYPSFMELDHISELNKLLSEKGIKVMF